MKVTDLLTFMGECGARYHESQIPDIVSYFMKMIHDERVVIFSSDSQIEAMLVYSMTNDINIFYKKKSWDYLRQDPDGTIVYLEMMVSREWNKDLRIKFEEAIAKKFPQFEYGCWFRATDGNDRMVKVRRIACQNIK